MVRRTVFIVFVFLGVLAFADAAKRLVLKDGSYQSVVKYEIKGDRVRYLSAERYEWEEIPKELIDWDATKKYEEDLKKAVAHDAEQVDKEIEEEKALENAQTPEIAPNLRLPITGGVFVLDHYNQVPQLVELSQSTSQIDDNTAGNILRKQINPFSGRKQTVQVPGPRAKVQVHVGRPVIYLNVDTDPENTGAVAKKQENGIRPTSDAYRFVMVKLNLKKDHRVLGIIKTSFSGETTQEQTIVPTVGEIAPGGMWIKLQPKQDLGPGEYAVAEMLGEKEMNLYVWDFGVDPKAPANASAWKPDQNIQTQTPKQPPKLETRKKSD